MYQKINKILNIKNDIKRNIDDVYFGEQPVGTCFILNLNNTQYKYCAHVPVKRLPQSDISKTLKVYISFRALLTEILHHNKYNDEKIKTILCSPFGIEDDNMDVNEIAVQMMVAHSQIDMNMKCTKENYELITKLLV